MLIVLSPAKTLDFETIAPTPEYSQASLLSQSELLIDRCQKLSMQDIASLMKVSDKIAGLNVARFADWQQPLTLDNAKQALFAFKGDVYTGLQAETLAPSVLTYAQQHLRILSGLYGLLKPLDLMLAYRLEMGTKLDNFRGANLYQFWGSMVTSEVNKALQEQGDSILVNLASNEYFKAVKKKELLGQIITPIFKDQKNGQYKVISFYAKKARGLMARYILENEITEVEQLKEFDVDGYYFLPADSSVTDLVFYRDEK
ncbi:peroxide stress protein YaaA [Psychromonas sp. Urea-02u-13]|uniref:peroxide stress protein YaaA n=1 Tax=Psychromonas sp. Urea-02u-13 TaxID=2058326 RepID=UPI000C334CA3|nr:peroxide stress protein YaaA [Psychromonas sp. Urea-02u-13]PKG38811.1 peroxide stress protein YaaA [Psychromonas sp. Urea-02u-13]